MKSHSLLVWISYLLIFGGFIHQSASLLLAQEQNGGIALGEEYSEYKKESPKASGGGGGGGSSSFARTALLYIPNRVVDLFDVFRADVGVGPAVGGVVRISQYGQAGIRTVAPASLRVGLFGRQLPVKLESSNEFGIGPAFVKSKDRKVTPAEVGVGVDLFLVGAYLGISLDELLDFGVGIFGGDIKGDDIK